MQRSVMAVESDRERCINHGVDLSAAIILAWSSRGGA